MNSIYQKKKRKLKKRRQPPKAHTRCAVRPFKPMATGASWMKAAFGPTAPNSLRPRHESVPLVIAHACPFPIAKSLAGPAIVTAGTRSFGPLAERRLKPQHSTCDDVLSAHVIEGAVRMRHSILPSVCLIPYSCVQVTFWVASA